MTQKVFIIGHPIKHSRSPLIHGHWLTQHGLDGTYEKIDLAPHDLGRFLAEFPARGYIGGNVTVPHKEAVLPRLGRITDTAAAMGAVNTLWLAGDELNGDNTDILGFLANLDEATPGWSEAGGRAVVLGAGGAARAVVYGLLGRGFSSIALVNRSRARAEALAGRFGPAVTVAGWGEWATALAGAALLVNTTSLGMAGQPPLDLDLAALPRGAIVNDVVYVPLETPLIAEARGRGFKVAGGLGMLLHQAVPAFARWFGVSPRVTPELRTLIEADIARTG